MRIGMEAKRAFCNGTGLGVYNRGIVRNLIEIGGHDLVLYTPRIGEEFSEQLSDLAYDVVTPGKYQIPAVWRSKGMVNALDRDLDLFHGPSHELPVGVEKILPTVVTMHDLIHRRFPNWYPAIDRMIYEKKFYSACARAHKVVCVSEQTAEDVRKFYGVDSSRIEVVYQDCGEEFETLDESENEHGDYVLYLGTVNQRKNALGLIEAFALALPELKGMKLLIAGGGGAYKNQCEQRVQELGLKSCIKFLGRVPNEQRRSLYRHAKAFCYPSFFEGFGIPMIEALWQKTPVICSEGGVFPEAAGPGAFYVDPASIDSIANALVEACRENVQDRVEQGYQFVQKFSRSAVTSHMNSVYEQALQAKNT